MKHLVAFLLLLSVAACNGSKQSAAKKEEAKTQAVLEESLQQKQAAGTDLYAKGSIPSSWTLEIDFDRIIRFRSLDGTDYKSSPAAPVENTSNNSSTYLVKAGKGTMLISLFNQSCTDALSGEKFSKKITVEVDGKRYEGCGQYLSDPGLGGKWILEKIGSKTVLPADFAKGLPELVFNLESGDISGHDGCNRISGSMEVQGNRIKFGPLAGTKMACPGNKAENNFTQKISSNVATYYFKDGQLVLYLIDDSIITFKKA